MNYNTTQGIIHSFIAFAKFPEKTNISYLLICKRSCAYQGVRNVSFSENFANVINGCFPAEMNQNALIAKVSICQKNDTLFKIDEKGN